MNTQSLTNQIIQMMNKIEIRTGKMMSELNKDLENQAWVAIDSKNVAKLSQIVKELDTLG